MKYLILQNPGHNRVYYNSSAKLALAELNIACCKLSVDFEKIDIVEIEGIRYLSFRTNEPLSDNDIRIISRLSFIFAFYSEEKFNELIQEVAKKLLANAQEEAEKLKKEKG